MKTVVVTKPHEYKIIDEPVPGDLGDHGVLIKMKALGVCGGDQKVFLGENPFSSYPVIPFHENAGIVEALGRDVKGISVGDHVVVDAANACGKCHQCKAGRKNLCESVRVRGSNIDGGMREYMTAPEEDVYVISKSIDWLDAAMIEPFTIGGQAVSRGRVKEGETVYVYGTGTIASTIVQLCKLAGAVVICAGRNALTLERAKGYGADFVIDTNQDSPAERVSEITSGEGACVAFDTVCHDGSIAGLFAPGIVRGGGRIVSIGFCTANEVSQAMVVRKEIELLGSRLSSNQFGFMAKAMEEGKISTKGLITHVFRFDEIDKVYNYLENPDAMVKKMAIAFDSSQA